MTDERYDVAKDPWCHLSAPELDRLDHAALIVRHAFEEVPYLVGSCLERPDYRDVDVRLIMDDEDYDALFTGQGKQRANPLWSLLCASISEYLNRLTDLPIDFQFQRRTDANEQWAEKPRHPLGLYVAMYR